MPRTRPPNPRARLVGRDFQTRDAFLGVFLILPALVWLGIIVLVPLVSAISTSFTSLRIPGGSSEAVGFDNYVALWSDSEFRSTLLRSAIWVVTNGVLQTVVALGVALMLNRPFWGQNFVRSWIVLPWVVPLAVIAILWKWMLDATAGVVNGLLLGVGVVDEPIVFLGQTATAFPSLIGINSWRLFPFLTIIILGALQMVPKAEYEAAQVDGASRLMQFRSITFPHLVPTLTVLGLVGTLWAANMFDLIWMVTRGGPIDSTTTAPVFIYDRAFASFNMSSAAAASVVFLVLLVAFAVIFSISARRSLRRVDETFIRARRAKGGTS